MSVLSIVTFTSIVLAQGDVSAVASSAAAPQGGGIMSLLPLFAMVFGIFYFLVLRPQEKEQRAHQLLLEALKPGARLVTSGGIIGKVITVEENELVLEISNGVRVQFEKSAVVRLLDAPEGKVSTSAESEGQKRKAG